MVEEIRITCEADIRKALKEFVNQQQESAVNTKLSSRAEDGRTVMYDVKANVGCDYPSMLIKGFEMVKRRIESAERIKNKQIDAMPIFSTERHLWLDDLIERRLGGRRDGLRIKWELHGVVYFYDPFLKKLTKCI